MPLPGDEAAEIPGAGRLIDLYGYWITFHDAIVETIVIERVGPSVTIDFETCDLALEDGVEVDRDRKAHVVIRWSGVEDLRLEGIDPSGRNWINELTFTSHDGRIRSELMLMDGIQGFIASRRVEVVDVRPLGSASR